MNRKILLMGVMMTFAGSLALPVLAAEPIEGDWKTEVGDTARIAPCAQGFCITLVNGKYAGKEIGHMKGNGGLYSGQVTKPQNNKTYDGSAAVTGNKLKLQGCALKIFCESQVWTRL